MATFKKRLEYIASTTEHPCRFTIKDVSYTNETGDVYEFEYENNFYSPFSSVYEGKADVRGWFYSLRSSGELQVGAGTTQDAGFVTQANTWYKLKISTEAGGNVKLYINGNQVAHNTGGTVATVTIIPIMWGKGNNEFNVPHKKKSFKMWKNGTLLYDYIPVLDDNDVPCWFDRVNKDLLYADAGYTPTVYGNEVPMYASEVEYIGSNANARFTISNLGITTSKNLLIESDIKWLNYSNAINGEYRLDLVGGWQGANSSGKWILASGIAGGNVSTTEFQNVKFYLDNTHSRTSILIDNEETIYRVTNPLTIDYVNVFYGTYGATTYYANNLKKYIKVFIDDELVRDYVPVIDIDGVPAFYDKVTNTMLYADAGYTPTIVGGTVEYECGDGLRERQLLIANKTILPYYCELESISYPTLFAYDMTVSATSVIEIETAIKYLGSIGGGNQLEGNSTAGRWYGIDDNGKYILGGGITSATSASTTNFDVIKNVQNLATATATLNVNGVDLLTRTGIASTTSLTYGMFGVAGYRLNVAKKYHKVWVDGILVYDYIPVLTYNGVPCWYNRVDGQFLYSEAGQTPTVWGREIHPIERIHCNKNYYYNIVNFLNIDDTLGCKVFIESDSGGNASNVFLGSDGVNTAFTITYNQNNNLVYRWFSTTYQYAVGLGQHYRVDEIEFNKNHIVVNGIEETNVTSDVTTLANCRLFGANSISSMLGWLYNCWIKDPFGAYKMYLIPFVDETGTAGVFDTITRTILEKYASGVPTYDDILLDSIENKVLTDANTGGPYIHLPVMVKEDVEVKARLFFTDSSTTRYCFGNGYCYVAHYSNNDTKFLYGNNGVTISQTTPTIRLRKKQTKNFINDVEVTSNTENEFTANVVLSLFTSSSLKNGMVGGYNYFYFKSNGEEYNLVPTIRNGVIGMVNTLDGTMYPNLRSGVDFFPNFFPQKKQFNALEGKEYLEIEIDTTLESANNKSYDFNHTASVNYFTDWGDGNVEANSKSHTYATAGAYTVRIFKNDTTFPDIRFGENDSTHPTCLKKVNTAIPKFATSIVAYNYVFLGCTNLTYVIGNYFDNNTHVTDISRSFRKCTSLRSINKDWLKNLVNITSVVHLFSEMANLEAIPSGLFDNNTKIQMASNLFTGPNKITSIPAHLLDNQTSMASIASSFSSCSYLTTVPDDLFKFNTNLGSCNYIFQNDYALETIPEYLFRYNHKVGTFAYCFRNCRNLKLNSNIFCDEATESSTRFTTKTPDFTECFNISTTGFSGTQGTAPELWNYTYSETPTTTDCFKGQTATSLTNYASIPSAWGGPA